MRKSLIGLILLLLISSAPVTASPDWLSFRYDAGRTGRIPGRGDLPGSPLMKPRVKWIYYPVSVAPLASHPIITDWDGDGHKDVIVVDAYSRPLILKGETGALIPTSIPISLTFKGAEPSCGDTNEGCGLYLGGGSLALIYLAEGDILKGGLDGFAISPPLVMDVDNDGRDEMFIATDMGKLYLLNEDLSVIWSVDLGLRGRTLAGGDVNNDGDLEVIVGTEEGYLVALNSKGVELWRYQLGGAIKSISIVDGLVIASSREGALGVLDGNGQLTCKLQISSISSDIGIAERENIAILGTSSGEVALLFTNNCTIRVSPFDLGEVTDGPIIADFDSDGNEEAMFGTSLGYIFSVALPDLRLEWSYRAGSSTPLLASDDLDGDSLLEVVASLEDRVLVLEGSTTKTLLPEYPFIQIFSPPYGLYTNEDVLQVKYKVIYNETKPVDVRLRLGKGGVMKLLDVETRNTNTYYFYELNMSNMGDGIYLVNVAANVDGQVAEASSMFFLDRTPPSIEIISPKPGDKVLKGSELDASWNLYDNLDPLPEVSILLSKDNETWSLIAGPIREGIGSISLNTSKYEEGSYYIKVAARDRAGNYAEAVSGPLLIIGPQKDEVVTKTMAYSPEPNPPKLRVYSPKNGSVEDTAFRISFYVENSVKEDVKVRAEYRRKDGSKWFSLWNGTLPWVGSKEIKWYVGSLSPGYYVLKITAVGGRGKETSREVVVIVKKAVYDTSPPQVRIVEPQNSSYFNRPFKVKWMASDDTDSLLDLRCSLRKGLDETSLIISDNELYLRPEELGEGTFTLKIIAMDDSGKIGHSSLIFTIDVTPPKASLMGPSKVDLGDIVVLDASQSFDDTGIAVYRWDIDGDGKYEAETTDPYFKFVAERQGIYMPVVKIVDLAGNEASASVEIIVEGAKPTSTSAYNGEGLLEAAAIIIAIALLIEGIFLLRMNKEHQEPKKEEK